MKDKVLGHIACFMAYAIFGFNIIVTKNISDMHLISPFALFTFRAFGATILFWLVSYFLPKENIEKSDYKKIFMASMLGLFLTQMTFLEGILITTSLDASIISPLVPIFTMLVAAVALKEPITLKKAGGVVLGFLGVVLLILNSVGVSSNGVAQTQPMGVVLLVLNNVFFALYLGIFRPLISKYSVVTFMKWMFLFSLMVSLPFTIKEIVELEYVSIPFTYYISLAYLIVFATCIAYYLIPFGQKRLRPTVVSLYTYLQPLIASVMSIYLGMDRLTWQKILAAFLVVIAVLLVNRSRAKQS
ncbi:MAG: DMT family transporter [Paludibacteraceae bacterium]|nr:DMT family transporter [Paludibacteraceae bacterium]